MSSVQRHAPLFVRLLHLIDAGIVAAALFWIAQPGSQISGLPLITVALLMLLALEVIGSMLHLRRSLRVVRLRYELLELASTLAIGFVVLGTAISVLGGVDRGLAEAMPLLVRWFAVALAACVAFRILLRLGMRFLRAQGYDNRTAAFIGATETTARMITIFRQNRWMGLTVAGVFDDRLIDGEQRLEMARCEVAGTVGHLVELARLGEVHVVYVTLPMSAERRIEAIIRRFADTTVSIYYCPPLFRLNLLQSRWDDVFGQPVITVLETPFAGPSRIIKRTEDMVLVALMLPVVIPMMIVAALAIKLSSRGPILYRQTRYGLDGKPFSIWKFRTMRVEPEPVGFRQASPGDERVTKVGAILRKTSIDELPQLLNVLTGSMSVIGPRPHPVELNEDFRGRIEGYMIRHKAKPGITGLAQVNGLRGETDTPGKMERRVELDLAYLDSWSVGLDMKILLRTLRVPFVSENAY